MFLLAVAALSVGGCTRERPDGDGVPFGTDGGADARFALGDVQGFTPYDPFDPSSACAASAVPTVRVPGSLLVVFDRSSSMDEDPNGSRPGDRDFTESKWDLAERAVSEELGRVSPELSVGLLLYPSNRDDVCSVELGAGVPQVPIAPLSTSLPAIESALAGGTSGGQTPTFRALRAGYRVLDSLDTDGPRGIVLVTDGAENCERTDGADVLEDAQRRHDEQGYLSFAVGLDSRDNFLSTLAVNGGTQALEICEASCVAPPTRCATDSDCPGGGTCVPFVGFCTEPAGGASTCCHYDVSSGGFDTEFRRALAEISSRFLDSCVFRVPRPANPADFSPTLVNVGVTFDGDARIVVPQGSDPTEDSWHYTDTEYSSIEIEGELCDRLRTESATVEIVLGCPTILI
jgi:hypothetical protein